MIAGKDQNQQLLYLEQIQLVVIAGLELRKTVFKVWDLNPLAMSNLAW